MPVGSEVLFVTSLAHLQKFHGMPGTVARREMYERRCWKYEIRCGDRLVPGLLSENGAGIRLLPIDETFYKGEKVLMYNKYGFWVKQRVREVVTNKNLEVMGQNTEIVARIHRTQLPHYLHERPKLPARGGW